ncbi:MAG: rhomboid family intramembrane serine protease [Myxococcota bacterium]
MFPLRDRNPTRHTPFVTIALIAANVAAWVFLQALGDARGLAESICSLGLIPGELLGLVDEGTQVPLGPGLSCVIGGESAWHTVVTSMFMHGGWFHIIGNMWFLWVFGDNIEEALGPFRFALFYLVCGAAAAGAQVLANPDSTVPMVGASGAIGGVMGAYALLFPRAPIDTVLFFGFFFRVFQVPAVFMLGYWLLIQVLGGLPAFSGGGEGGGVAFWAHVGGFVAGVLLAYPMRARRR